MKKFLKSISLRGFYAQRAQFYMDMAESLSQKERIETFLEHELSKSLHPKTANKDLAKGILEIRAYMEASNSNIWIAMKHVMPLEDSVALVSIADSVSPGEDLIKLAQFCKDVGEINSVVRKSFIPVLVLSPIAGLFVYVLASYILPEAIKAAGTSDIWHGFPGLVKSVVTFLSGYGMPLLVVALSLLSAFFFLFLPNYTHQWRLDAESSYGWRRLLYCIVFPLTPVLTIYRDIQSAKTLSALSNLLNSGMLLRDALNVIAQNGTPWVAAHINLVIAHRSEFQSDDIGAFSHGLLGQFSLGRLQTLYRQQKQGKFDVALIQVSTKDIDRVKHDIHKKSSFGATVFMALLMCSILFFYLGQASITSAIKDANSPAAFQKNLLMKKQLK